MGRELRVDRVGLEVAGVDKYDQNTSYKILIS